MKDLFKKTSAGPLSEAEEALKTWGIDYEKQADGSLMVPGDLNISFKGLSKLPDLSEVKVGGDFYCNNNQLTSLEHAPRTVTGGFYCHDNQLTSLEHAPHTVGGSFSCSNNQLTSLEHAPQSVGRGFWCHDNQLTSLEHAPQTVGGDFWCHNNQLTSLEHAPRTVTGNFCCYNNQLTSLEHAPQSVGGGFYCRDNQLTLLEHAPQRFKMLKSDFGEFDSWNSVPEELRTSPETKARLEQERKAQAAVEIHNAVVLQNNIPIKGPLRLRQR